MKIELECPLFDSYNVQRIAGMFDVPVTSKLSTVIEVEEPPSIDDDWSIGCIVGNSGSGKSSIAKHIYGDNLYTAGDWRECAVIDNFGDTDIKEITSVLTAVGFSSPPSWIKPYSVLSNGEKFRCDLARGLLRGGLCVFDEFTSTTDRNVARICSMALAKGIRNGNIPSRFVAVTCHYDILDWLTPDWILDTATGVVERGLLRKRPDITLDIYKCHYSDWRLFSKHHYLNSDKISTSSQCYVAIFNKTPVAFCSVMANVGHKGRRRISRIVVLPDYQAAGIGRALLNFVANLYKERGLRISIGTSHPAMISALRRDGSGWVLTSVGDSHHNKG